MYDLHMDAKYWGDPASFRPERFLDPEGEIINSDRVMPFGLGKSA
jgi:cytochrome P450